MPRPRLAALAAPGVVALAVVGVAAAGHRSQSSQAAAASFAAGSVTQAHTKSCVAAGGTFADTTATYTGAASSSDSRLDGPLTIRAHSVVDTTTGIGWIEGRFRVRGNGTGAHGTLRAAIAGGRAVGSVVGQVEHAAGKLVASLSAAFTQGGGFASGAIGSGSVAGAGTIFSRGACRNATHLAATAIFHAKLKAKGVDGKASGNLTLNLVRDTNGAIVSGTAVFSVDYRFRAAVTVTSLGLHQGARGASGPLVLDAGTGTITDADGRGNVTKVVTGVSASLLQALLENPRGYYLQLDSSAGALRAQLGAPRRR